MEYCQETTTPATPIPLPTTTPLPTSIALHTQVLEDGGTELIITISQLSRNNLTGEITGPSISLNMSQFSHIMFLLKSVETGLVNQQHQSMTFGIQPLINTLLQDLPSTGDFTAPPPAPPRKRGIASRSSRSKTVSKKECTDSSTPVTTSISTDVTDIQAYDNL